MIYLFLIVLLYYSCSESKKISIGIQVLGNVEETIIDSLKTTITNEYDAKVSILENINIPKSSFVNIKSPRYRADSLLIYLKNIKPDSIDFIIGFTALDISTSKKDSKGNIKKPESKYKDWGVMGLGFRPGTSCIVSSYRLKHTNKSILMDRIKKVAVHELGHNLGLKHCEKNENCVMRDAAETVRTIDKVGFSLCRNCKSRI